MIDNLLKRLKFISKSCNEILTSILHEEFRVAGNIGVFAQSDEEHKEFSKIALELIRVSNNPNQKYFELVEPITFESPQATFTHLYIRKYDPTEYGKNLGDVDYVVNQVRYDEIKSKVINGEFTGATMYDRPGWDTIQMIKPEVRAVAYLSTQEMAEKVRLKFDNLNKAFVIFPPRKTDTSSYNG